MYRLFPNDPLFGRVTSVRRIADDAAIPFDEKNADYQRYLAWVASGGTPAPASDAQGEP